MKVLDPGHVYELDHLDSNGCGHSTLTFVKRAGPGYPGNVGAHEGTNIQDVLRVLIDRVQYLDRQIPNPHNSIVITLLRGCLRHLEMRAADRHGRSHDPLYSELIETLRTCPECGHIGCFGSCAI